MPTWMTRLLASKIVESNIPIIFPHQSDSFEVQPFWNGTYCKQNREKIGLMRYSETFNESLSQMSSKKQSFKGGGLLPEAHLTSLQTLSNYIHLGQRADKFWNVVEI